MVSSSWYINHCLSEALEEWCKCCPHHETQSLLLHHDSARAHTGCYSGLPGWRQHEYGHLLALPDLALFDWFMFPFVKQQLRGIQFQRPEDDGAYFEGIIFIIPSQYGQVSWIGGLRGWPSASMLREDSSRTELVNVLVCLFKKLQLQAPWYISWYHDEGKSVKNVKPFSCNFNEEVCKKMYARETVLVVFGQTCCSWSEYHVCENHGICSLIYK